MNFHYISLHFTHNRITIEERNLSGRSFRTILKQKSDRERTSVGETIDQTLYGGE